MIKKFCSLFTAMIVCLSMIFSASGNTEISLNKLEAQAVSADYPAVMFNIAAKDNSKVLTENGKSDGSALSVQPLGGSLAPTWRFDRVGSDSKGTFFKITNAESGRLITPDGYNVTAGTPVIIYGSESAQCQHWYVVPVKNDRLGNALYYKIVNYSDTSLALTQSTNGMTLASYTGADNQLWLLNADGLQGFAGYCANDNTGNIKAGDIGGLFGEIVEVSTFADLKKYAEASDPYTILVTKNISVTTLAQDSQSHLYCPDGRIYVTDNKTIVGAYGAHTLNNVQFCTKQGSGKGNNIIIKNFEMQHDAKSNGNDSIVVYFGSGQNLWVDHVTFVGHSGYNTLGESTPDWDKFLACCYDADYCTVSDCSFGLHEYGLILGYPDDTEDSYKNKNNFPRMTIAGCKFKDTYTRGPGLMRYGYFHSLNNYVYNFSMAYTVHSDCKLFAENCYYDGAKTNGNVVCDWNQVTHPGAFADSGSKGVNCRRLGIEGSAKVCTWRPESNYSYTKLTADAAKSYCDAFSGCQMSNGNMMYLRYSTKGVPSAGYTEAPSEPMRPTAASFPNGSCFTIKNVNSDLLLQVDGSAENNANIIQLGAATDTSRHIWKLWDAGDGYYYVTSFADNEGSVYCLDVEAKKTDNGANIDLYKYNGGENQKFKFLKNKDGSYRIVSKITGDKSAVEVSAGSKEEGANVQQWELNEASCQNWILVEEYDPGSYMDTSMIYEFENVNSGLVMDIVSGKMEEGTNVQQWGSNNFDCQRWTLETVPGWYPVYTIHSVSDADYVLTADGRENGSNISIQRYDQTNINQQFVFRRNIDGTYYVLPSANSELFVEIGAASKESGANVQLWGMTNSECQQWNAVTFTTTTTTTTSTTTTTTTTTSTTTTTATTTSEPAIELTVKLYGDANDNGKLEIADAVLIMQAIANKDAFGVGGTDTYAITPQGNLNADCYLPGSDLTGMDALAVQRKLVNLCELPVLFADN